MAAGISGPSDLRARLAPWLGRMELRLLAGALVVASLIYGFVQLADEVIEGDTQAFDDAVLHAFRTPGNLADPIGPAWLEEMARDVTALGSYAFLTLLLVVLVGYLLLLGKRATAVLMTVSVVGGALLSSVMKIGFARPRPELTPVAEVFTASFPSGHATLSAVAFLTLGAILARAESNNRIKIFFLAIAAFLSVLVGLSRVYLGVHYPTDVLAGWCIGTAWALACATVAFWLQRRGKVEPSTTAARDGATAD